MPIAALILSIALHFGLAVLLKTGGSGDEGGKGKKQAHVKVKLLDKPAPTESKKKKEKVQETKSKVVVPKKKDLPPEQKMVDHKCDEWYSGIGIQHKIPGCTIGHVAKGYPADRAGLQVGDLVITTDSDCPGRGPLGTMLTLKIMRGSQVLTKTMIREKICTSPEE